MSEGAEGGREERRVGGTEVRREGGKDGGNPSKAG